MHTIILYHAELMLSYALAKLGMCFPPHQSARTSRRKVRHFDCGGM